MEDSIYKLIAIIFVTAIFYVPVFISVRYGELWGITVTFILLLVFSIKK